MASSVPAADVALREALSGRPELDGVYVGPLVTETPTETERVYLGGEEDHSFDRIIQQRAYREEYVIVVYIEVEEIGRALDVHDSVKARGWAIFDVLAAVLDDDDELGGAVTAAALIATPSGITYPTGEGWRTQITSRVQVRAGGA